LALAAPVLVGFGGKWFGLGGPEMLGGLLAGVTTSGVLMAIFQSNAGGAWDNAKKMIEEKGLKGTDTHKAAVVGDTVGDPFKDTSGPSLNILLKLMSVVALVIAPSIALEADTVTAYIETAMPTTKEVKVIMNSNDEGVYTATVTTLTSNNGEEKTTEQVFKGTEDEVKANVEALNVKGNSAKALVEKVVEENVQ
jgi:K(+)-stimulated pyrophosphate-energized sodium pump